MGRSKFEGGDQAITGSGEAAIRLQRPFISLIRPICPIRPIESIQDTARMGPAGLIGLANVRVTNSMFANLAEA